jgi:hypothetical protein
MKQVFVNEQSEGVNGFRPYTSKSVMASILAGFAIGEEKDMPEIVALRGNAISLPQLRNLILVVANSMQKKFITKMINGTLKLIRVA